VAQTFRGFRDAPVQLIHAINKRQCHYSPLAQSPGPRLETLSGKNKRASLLYTIRAAGPAARKIRARKIDRGYDAEAIRQGLRERGIVPLLAMRNTEHGSGLSRWRSVAERRFAWSTSFADCASATRS